MLTYQQFTDNCQTLEARIEATCNACGRNVRDVKILPVTKGHPVTAVEYAQEYGFLAVGENWLQEAVAKREVFSGDINWECIGHVQGNKAKLAVAFDRIQSIDGIKLVQRIDRLAGEQGKVQRILLEVNTGEDPNKFGAMERDAPALLEATLACEYVRVEGLMTIAPLDRDPKPAFEGLRVLRDRLEVEFGVKLPELSMGMTDDFEVAIAAGSTLIRVGSALFGVREYRK